MGGFTPHSPLVPCVLAVSLSSCSSWLLTTEVMGEKMSRLRWPSLCPARGVSPLISRVLSLQQTLYR